MATMGVACVHDDSAQFIACGGPPRTRRAVAPTVTIAHQSRTREWPHVKIQREVEPVIDLHLLERVVIELESFELKYECCWQRVLIEATPLEFRHFDLTLVTHVCVFTFEKLSLHKRSKRLSNTCAPFDLQLDVEKVFMPLRGVWARAYR